MYLRWFLLALLLSPVVGAWALSTTSAASSSTSTSQTATQVIGSTLSANGACVASQTSVCDPFATTFDSSGNLWIADGVDNRVLEFPLVNGHISSSASAVIGQDNFTADVCGSGSWPAHMRTSVLCFPDGLAFDSHGNLWVADGGGSRVVEYPLVGGSISSRVTQIIGPNFTTTEPFAPLYGIALPVGIAFDKSGNLWVVDLSNSRVLEFPQVNGSISLVPSRTLGQGSLGAGACDQSSVLYNFQNATAYTLCEPSDLAFDQNGNLWVADFGQDPNLAGNSRIVMFPEVNGTLSSEATEVIGQGSFTGFGCDQNLGGSQNDTLCYPVSIAFDGAGDLWVADSGNNRVVEFASTGGTIAPVASRVVGQENFTSYFCNKGSANATDSSLCRPLWIAFDSRNDLWVSDTNNVRVLEFVAPSVGFSGLQTWLIIGGSAAFLIALVVTIILLRARPAKQPPAPAAEQPSPGIPEADPTKPPGENPVT